MKITLTQNQIAIIDDEDWEKIKNYKWLAHKGKNTFYAIAYIRGSGRKNQKYILLHRLILNVNKEQQIDHINNNGLDNRKNNLRIANTSQNNVNSKLSNKNKSGYRGVSLHKHSKLWRATIQYNKKHINTGYFKNPKEAAKARDKIAIKLYGKFAKLNFPQGGDSYPIL